MELNIDPSEVEKFDALAEHWWNPEGPLNTLHRINPLRLDYIERYANLSGASVLDVGCGAGLLTELMARRGADVTGLDMAETSLLVARSHAAAEALEIDYLLGDVESYAGSATQRFDIVTCLEMLEHVPNPASVVAACGCLVRPGGHVFFSTINRNIKSFALAIVAAEYLLGLLPKGTHQYRRLIRPSELAAWCRQAGLAVDDLTGVHWQPLSREFGVGNNVDVNFMLHAINASAR